MIQKIFRQNIVICAALYVLLVTGLLAQPVGNTNNPSVVFDAANNIKIPVTVTDTLKHSQILWLGWHKNAVNCLDHVPLVFAPCDSIIDYELPPTPLPGVFDVRFVNPFNSRLFHCGEDAGLGQGTLFDIRALISSTQSDTFRVYFQAWNYAYPFTITWPTGLSTFFNNARAIYKPDGDTTNMLTSTSMQINTDQDNFLILTSGVKSSQLPPDITTLLSPVNGALKQPMPIKFKWRSVTGAAFYDLIVATDTFFSSSSFVYRDSLITDTTRTVPGLPEGTKLFWQVKVRNNFLWGCYTTPFSLITALVTPPLLSSPADSAIGVSVLPTLRCRKIYGGISYQALLSDNKLFTDTIQLITRSDTAFPVTVTLDSCVAYYWKVLASTVYDTSPYSAPRMFTVIDAIPADPALSTPADSALLPKFPESATLTWSGDVCSRKYQIEVSHDTAFAHLVDSARITATTFTTSTLQGQERYYWRVAALNTPGKFGPYSPVRTFTTDVFKPRVPVLVSPPNAGVVPSTTVDLLWNLPLNKPTSYRILIDTTTLFNSPLKMDLSSSDTTIEISGLNYCTRYYWKVKAKNSADSSDFSAIFYFDIQRHIPGAPILRYPAIGATGLEEDQTLRWSGDKCSQQYYVQVAIDSAFAIITAQATLNDTFFNIVADEPLTKYYWRVQAINELGNGPFDTSYFTTVALTRPKAPKLVSPDSIAIGVLKNPTMCWDSSKRTATYRLQVALDTGFTLMVFNDSTLTTLCKQIGPLIYSRTYYWRVNAKNAAGTSDYRSVWRFSTLFPPDKPHLLEPEDGVTGVPLEPQLQWSIPERADNYQLQVARDTGFTVMIYEDSLITPQSWQLFNLSKKTVYYWHVRAKNLAGYGPWSTTFSFKTTLVGPANWVIPLSISETGFGQDSLYFGFHPNATFGIDPQLGEFQLPPPMLGQFDVRFVDIPTRSGLLGEGLRKNILPFMAYAQVDTFKFTFQLGTGVYPVHISWDANFVRGICDSMVLTDLYGGLGLYERMDLVSSATVTNISTKSLLIIAYGAFPIPTDVKTQEPTIPSGFSLSQNYPNPFNPETRIEFTNEKPATIYLGVFDVLGRELITLVNANMPAGFHNVTWNGQNRDGIVLPSGVYYLRMIATPADDISQPYLSSRKMLFMK